MLYFTRKEQINIRIPPHLACRTRSEANLLGREGPCVEDIQYFSKNCRTHFAKFPAIDVESHLDAPSEGLILSETSYKLGTLSGSWQGSNIVGFLPFYTLKLVTFYLDTITGKVRRVEVELCTG